MRNRRQIKNKEYVKKWIYELEVANGDHPKRLQNLSFFVTLIPYEGNTDWVEKAIFEAHRCLISDLLPEANAGCEYCAYRAAARGWSKDYQTYL